MGHSIKPFVVTSALSFAVHGMVVAAVLLLQGELSAESVGPGINIELISSKKVADNAAVEQIFRTLPGQPIPVQPIVAQPMAVQKAVVIPEKVLQKIRVVQTSQHDSLTANTVNKIELDKSSVAESVSLEVPQENVARLNQVANASQQQHFFIALLHRRISDNKEYPYIARRQRRQGVVTVEFILHPDGKVENTQLLSSSHTRTLDRAALLAVKNIEPFLAAQDYLQQSEKFQVDVVFNLL